jgi:hypothetical protein
MKRALIALLALAALLRASTVQAQECGDAARAWAAACSASVGTLVEALRCPEGRLILSLAGKRGRSLVEVTDDQPAALRHVRGVGLSPIAEFARWEEAPEDVRTAFERAVACVERDPAIPLHAPAVRVEAAAAGRNALPWLSVLGLALAGGASVLRRRRVTRRHARTAALLFGLAIVTFALARALGTATFFHQNGHGPSWVRYAFGDPCPYGPGFAELFGWAVRLCPARPESALFLCNAVLTALAPPLAWLVARRVGARRSLAWAVALAVAIDPLALRMAFTESYYVPYVTLLLAATALALAAPTLRLWSWRFLALNAAAGLLVAQAVRIHPVGWIAAALVPLAHLFRRGALRRRLAHVALAAATMGAVVAATSLRAMAAVLRGEMGTHYLPELERNSPLELRTALALLVVTGLATAGALALRSRRGTTSRILGLGLTAAAAATGTSLLRIDVDWVRAAHGRMFLASLLAAGVGMLARLAQSSNRTRAIAARVPALIAALGIVHAGLHLRWLTELPTDALELRLALSWRARIPPGAVLAAVERAGALAVQVPVFTPLAQAHLVSLDAQDAPLALGSLGDQVFYYRSSLCTTATGRGFCDAVERSVTLAPVEVHELPARPSTHACVYDAPTVRVGLYRVVSK